MRALAYCLTLGAAGPDQEVSTNPSLLCACVRTGQPLLVRLRRLANPRAACRDRRARGAVPANGAAERSGCLRERHFATSMMYESPVVRSTRYVS